MSGVVGEKPKRRKRRRQGRFDPKFLEVEALPDGIEVIHRPSPVTAAVHDWSGRTYTWVFRTMVRAIEGPVTIVEFGTFAQVPGAGWTLSTFTQKPFTNADFAEWYSCPGGVLEPGREYTDPRNWTACDVLRRDGSLWYYIGVRPDGTRVKGTSVVEELPVLDQ